MDVLATGYPSLDFITQVSHSPTIGETALLRELPDSFNFGGCGANVAVALARLGFKPGLAMVVGDDGEGEQYLRYLTETGVDVTNIIRLPGEITSRSYLFVNPQGQYQNFFFPGAADAWLGELQLTAVSSYRFALVTVGAYRYNQQYVQRIKQAGIPLVWMLKPDIHAYPPDMVGDFLSASSYVVMNHIEADYVMKALGFTSLEQCLNDRLRAVVLTRGDQGSEVYSSGSVISIRAVPPRQIVDPTGAGDGFMAGFLAGLLCEATPAISAQLGATVASFVLEAVGCQTNLPTWQAVMERYNTYFGSFEGDHD